MTPEPCAEIERLLRGRQVQGVDLVRPLSAAPLGLVHTKASASETQPFQKAKAIKKTVDVKLVFTATRYGPACILKVPPPLRQ